jgi:ubiquinone/menaquinone biosynthesis C-methylase UbiE
MLTKNKYGSMFPLSGYTKAFIQYAHKTGGTMLDIGAAYGVTTIPTLKKGAAVIANDISQEQLDILVHNTPRSLRKNLSLLEGRFPEFDLPPNTLDGILASHILHFLDPGQLQSGLSKMHCWLKPQAKIFVLCFTPYHKFMAKMIPEYEAKIAAGNPWPGYTEHSENYVLQQNLLPATVNLMDPTVLAREFIHAQFQIERVEFTSCPKGVNPDFFPLDGREWVGLIAYKSS